MYSYIFFTALFASIGLVVLLFSYSDYKRGGRARENHRRDALLGSFVFFMSAFMLWPVGLLGVAGYLTYDILKSKGE